MAVAKLLLKNDVGLVLDITESPLACTVYDLEGNQIGGGGGGIDYIRNIPITHVFPEGKTKDDFSALYLKNYIEVDEDYGALLDGFFGQNILLYDDSIILLKNGDAALCKAHPYGEDTNSNPYYANITGNDVVSYGFDSVKITGNSPLTFTWTRQ